MQFSFSEERLLIRDRNVAEGDFVFGERFLAWKEFSGSCFVEGEGESNKDKLEKEKLLKQIREEIEKLLTGLPPQISDFFKKLGESDIDFLKYLQLKLGAFEGRVLSDEEIQNVLEWQPTIDSSKSACFFNPECRHFRNSDFEKVILEALKVLESQKDPKKIGILVAAAKHKFGNCSTRAISEFARIKEIPTLKKTRERVAPFLGEVEEIIGGTLESVSRLLKFERELSKK